ncbi:class I SAM-dependent methyltransferase [Rhodoligotrophos defluvii]|uniref:class I SAM-dependent methyltransferase n=1 Tax=Rhodoligotrophos defluvii TaxID=2561934 RepID=UPI0010C985AB|nr:class I SAM-dependent methyltransferase [Rhodoligotrophos defluvii]
MLSLAMSAAELGAYIRESGLAELPAFDAAFRGENRYDSVDPANKTPFPPQWRDLVRLHRLVRDRKVMTILEFGVGWSTLVLAHALACNEVAYGQQIDGLRKATPFELFSVDDMAEFIESTRQMMPEHLRARVTLQFSPCAMGTFNGRICTYYETLPNICPDLIYLDGPSQFSVTGDVRGISTRAKDRMPMAADLLTLEHFLLPGTLVLVDGRTANARFLRANFQRNWRYTHDSESDVHLFELTEPPLGKINQAQIEFCLGSEWLRSLND